MNKPRLSFPGIVLAWLFCGAFAGCDSSASPPIDDKGQVRLPERPGPSQQEQRAKFLEQEKQNRPGVGR